MCQESDSSRQVRGELGLCSRGTEAEEAADSHSSILALIREMMGKHVDAGEKKKIIKFAKCLENVHLLWGSQDTICVSKCCCVGCELWACSDLIQPPPPLCLQCSLLSLPNSPGFHHCSCLYGNKCRRSRQQFLFSLLLMGLWLPTKSTFKLKHILNNVISNMCNKNKMTECPDRD